MYWASADHHLVSLLHPLILSRLLVLHLHVHIILRSRIVTTAVPFLWKITHLSLSIEQMGLDLKIFFFLVVAVVSGRGWSVCEHGASLMSWINLRIKWIDRRMLCRVVLNVLGCQVPTLMRSWAVVNHVVLANFVLEAASDTMGCCRAREVHVVAEGGAIETGCCFALVVALIKHSISITTWLSVRVFRVWVSWSFHVGAMLWHLLLSSKAKCSLWASLVCFILGVIISICFLNMYFLVFLVKHSSDLLLHLLFVGNLSIDLGRSNPLIQAHNFLCVLASIWVILGCLGQV